MTVELREGAIVLFRPLHELKSHIANFTVPDLCLLARVVKVCVMAFFRGHFYEIDSVCLCSGTTFIYKIGKKTRAGLSFQLREVRPFSFESAIVWTPTDNRYSTNVEFKKVEQMPALTLDAVVSYLREIQADEQFLRGVPVWNHTGFQLFTGTIG